jgi:quercetin dioxygenase-like cupin family protein
MAELQAKRFESPDEVRPFVADQGKLELVQLGGSAVGRGTFEPGWRWSEHVKPLSGTDSCQVEHIGYVQQGQMKVVMDDGTELTVGPGDVFHMPPRPRRLDRRRRGLRAARLRRPERLREGGGLSDGGRGSAPVSARLGSRASLAPRSP